MSQKSNFVEQRQEEMFLKIKPSMILTKKETTHRQKEPIIGRAHLPHPSGGLTSHFTLPSSQSFI